MMYNKNQVEAFYVSPSGRFRPPAEVARFLAPSLSSRSELRRDNCVAPPPNETFDIDVERRLFQYDPLGVTKFTSTGSRSRGVDEPNANAIELRSFRLFVSSRASRSWFFRKMYSRRSFSASIIAFFRSSTYGKSEKKENKLLKRFVHSNQMRKYCNHEVGIDWLKFGI